MTKIKIFPWSWLYLCIVLDWCTKEIIGYSLSMRSKTDDWLDAVELPVASRFPEGIREALKAQQIFPALRQRLPADKPAFYDELLAFKHQPNQRAG